MNLSGGGYTDEPWCHIKISAEALSEQTLLWRAIALFPRSGSAWLYCFWCFLSLSSPPPPPFFCFLPLHDMKVVVVVVVVVVLMVMMINSLLFVVPVLNRPDSTKGRMDYLSAMAGSSLCLDWIWQMSVLVNKWAAVAIWFNSSQRSHIRCWGEHVLGGRFVAPSVVRCVCHSQVKPPHSHKRKRNNERGYWTDKFPYFVGELLCPVNDLLCTLCFFYVCVSLSFW